MKGNSPVFPNPPPLPAAETAGTCKVTWTSPARPRTKVSKGIIANTHQGYEIHWTIDKNSQFSAKLRLSTGYAPLITCTVADNRWLAYWDTERKRVDLLDLEQGQLIWEFRSDEKPSYAEFEANNSLLKVGFGLKDSKNDAHPRRLRLSATVHKVAGAP